MDALNTEAREVSRAKAACQPSAERADNERAASPWPNMTNLIVDAADGPGWLTADRLSAPLYHTDLSIYFSFSTLISSLNQVRVG